jgi:hypothetical protein
VSTAELADHVVPRPRRRRRRWVAALVVVILGAGGAATAVTMPFRDPPAKSGTADNAATTSLATVTRRTLNAQTSVTATLGYADTYSVVNKAMGTITAVPDVGTVVKRGQTLYDVDGNPVILLYGSVPAYRTLAEGASASDVTGPDVQELNANLVALGYASASDLDPTSDEFSWATKDALKRLQSDLGLKETGVLTLGQAVFLPGPARITEVKATLGSPAGPGSPVMAATSTTREVSIALEATLQSQVKVGDKVTITLPDNSTTPGVVTSVGTVATAPANGGADSSPTITVTVKLTHPAATGRLDKAPVQVSITTATIRNAVVVPVAALVALSGGGYAVEVVAADGVHHLVPVSLGLFDDSDGLVQVTGSRLAAGQRIVVPAS